MGYISPLDGIVSNTKYVLDGYPILKYNPWKLTSTNQTAKITELNGKIDEVLGSLDSHAQGMYTRFSPLKPRVDLGQTFAEIREIPRMFLHSLKSLKRTARYFADEWVQRRGWKRSFGPKHIASEWLNNQFGWVPFVGTLTDLITTVRNLQRNFDRLRDRNGEWEKRGGRIATIVDTDAGGTGTCSYSFIADSRFTEQLTYSVRRYCTLDAWFEASYRYYIPELRNVKYPISLLQNMLGLRISPKLLWDLVPWSWMADWFLDLDDILAKADDSQFGQLVTKDAYAMGRAIMNDMVDYKFKVSSSSGSRTIYGTAAFPLVRQKRVRGTPFGFGVHSSDLSPWKVSILAALGLSMRHW